MMFCKFCGNALDDDAVFCSKCGAQVVLQTNVATEDIATQEQSAIDEDNLKQVNFELVKDSVSNDCAIASDIVENNFSHMSKSEVDKDKPTVESKEKEAVIKKEKRTVAVKRNAIGTMISGLVFAFLGIFIFLTIITVSCIKYDGIYFVGNYYESEFLVASIFSICFMLASIILFMTRLIIGSAYKNKGKYSTKSATKAVAIILIVVCLAFTIWTFIGIDDYYISSDSNGGSSNWGTGNNGGSIGGGSSTYFSFYDVYKKCGCAYPWADWGTSYLSIDTNPYNYDGDYNSSKTYLIVATDAIKKVNSELGLPSYLYQEMMETRAIDGRQVYNGKKFNASWRYHPDTGLEVRYTKADE